MKRTLLSCLVLAVALSLVLSPAAEAAKKRLAFGGGPTGGTFQYFSNAIAILLSNEDPLGVDLVVMGAHGRSPVMKAVLGSTAQRVVCGSPVPVLLVRIPE